MLLSLIMKSKEKRIGIAPSTEQTIKRKPTDTSRDEQSDGPIETIDIISSDDESDNDDADDEDYKPTSHSRRKTTSLEARSADSGVHTTLVVAPLSLVLQWEEEISTKTDLSCLVYYGNTRGNATSRSFRGVDVVLTTYGTLQTEYLQSTSSSPKGVKPTTLLSHQWERVIVDEAHQIKNPSTAVSKSCYSIIAAKRWAVTGTPIQNSLQDVFGLMKFLRHEPWCNNAFWKTAITTTEPTSDGTGPGIAVSTSEQHGMSLAMDRVRRILHPLILRRTKETIGADGKPILTLPPIDSSVVSVHLTEPEREFYTALLDKSQHVFEGLLKAGTASKSWLAIFSLLQRLRQSCDHVALTVKPRFTDSGSAASASETSDDQEDSTSDDTAINKKFLSNLLQMFAKQTDKSNGNQQPAPSSPSKSSGKATETGEPSSAFISQVVQSLTESVDDGGKIKEECPLCLDCPDISSAVLTPCAHTMCLDCLRPVLKQSANTSKRGETSTPQCQNALSLKDGPCPVCSAHVEASRIVSFSKSEETGDVTSQFVGDIPMPEGAESLNMNMDPTAMSARETLLASLSGGESSKLVAVKRELDAIWRLDKGSKVLIFSQYLGFLDILGISLRKEGIPVFRLDGQMSLEERVEALDRFNKAKSTSTRCTGDTQEEEIVRGSVFLASMKAGGVGINLVAASSVFILDPWWNFATEDQCINRIHRIGQKAPIVRVRKFVVTDSVEEKIVRLQQTKKSMANNILDANTDGSDASSGSKPTLDDFKILLGR